jgi:hypothetical protein
VRVDPLAWGAVGLAARALPAASDHAVCPPKPSPPNPLPLLAELLGMGAGLWVWRGQLLPEVPATVGCTCRLHTLTETARWTVWVVFAGVVATECENVQEPLVTGLKFIHSTLADA